MQMYHFTYTEASGENRVCVNVPAFKNDLIANGSTNIKMTMMTNKEVMKFIKTGVFAR